MEIAERHRGDGASSAEEKGHALEELVARLFSTVEGFDVLRRVRTATEELDLLILNGSEARLWRDMGPALLVECKNWSGKCGAPEYRGFEAKLHNRHGQCRCGFFISWNGFTSRFRDERLRSSREGHLILLLDRVTLRRAIDGEVFSSVLTELWAEAICC